MSHIRSVGLALGIGSAASACAPLPRISTSHTCNGSTPSQLVVRAVDGAGKDVPFAPVFVTSDDRSTRVTASTSSLGTVKLPLRAGSYRVAVGDNAGDWQLAARTFDLRPGCSVTARAELIRYEIDPVDTPLRKRIAR
jgi:hypothetical protein